MKVTRIEVEGAEGRAVLTRRSIRVGESGQKASLIHAEAFEHIDLGEKSPCYRPVGISTAGSQNETAKCDLAVWLQSQLDGYKGTAGDVAEYLRVVEMLGA